MTAGAVTDCLIIGPSDVDFPSHLNMLRMVFGRRSGAYQDQDLTFVTRGGKPYRVLDLINEVNGDRLSRPLTNTDFLWPTILVLGTYLAKHGLSFDYVNQFSYEREALKAKLRTRRYRAIAITTTLYVTDVPIRAIIDEVRAIDPAIVVIVGGPYIRNRLVDRDPSDVERELDALGGDVYVNSSEGQEALVGVLRALASTQSLRSVSNLVYRTRLDQQTPPSIEDRRTAELERFTFTALATEYMPLDGNPVDYDLFPRTEIGSFISLATAKSCPYSCAFCGFPSRAGAYTYLDIDAVECELDKLQRLGVETLTFLDDTFNVPKKRFKEMLRMMIRNGYGFRWNSFYRSDQGDAETIELMARSGCEGVFLGIESGSDEMLAMMRKTSRRRHYEAAIPLLKEVGIYTHANFIVGFPGETDATARETLEFIQAYEPHTYKAQLWYADNTSPIWADRETLSIKGGGFDWSHRTMTSARATELVDMMVQEITRSAFLPQDGFGMWCIFYLQRKGMPLDQVLEFLHVFGSEVRRKRREPDRQEIPAATMDRLVVLGTLPSASSRPNPTAISIGA